MTDWQDELTEPADELFAPAKTAESVTALTRRVKTLLERGVGEVRVKGEVSNFRRQSSGHCYFQLKDAGAQLACVMFRGDAARQTVDVGDGLQVVLGGEISVYEARGQYQLIVREVEEDGIGRLQREFEALKRRLAAEGLFDADRKRALPALPLRIAIVTSPTGAAVQDFLRILLRRGWRGRLVVVPAKVQGEGAAEEITAGIAWANTVGDFDLIVTGRGGGSLEDLWAFNEEPVVRAIAGSDIPVISAVGHEIDFTLADFAADVRAETPSGAAELVSSAYQDQISRMMEAAADLAGYVNGAVRDHRRDLQGLKDRLRLLAPRAQIEQGWLRRDDLANRLRRSLDQTVNQHQQRIQLTRMRWETLDPQRRVESESQRLLSLWQRLQAVSPESTLRRGFTIVRDSAGRPVMRKAAVQPGGSYEIEFADGRRSATFDADDSK